MHLQEAIEEVENYAMWMNKPNPQEICSNLKQAIETLIAHARQPMQVTDEMVKAAWLAFIENRQDTDGCCTKGLRAALQAALNVQGGE